MLQGDKIVVPGLTDEEIEALPEFEGGDQFPVVDTDSEFEIRLAQQ